MKAGVSAMVFALAALRHLGYAPGSDVYVETVTEEECTGQRRAFDARARLPGRRLPHPGADRAAHLARHGRRDVVSPEAARPAGPCVAQRRGDERDPLGLRPHRGDPRIHEEAERARQEPPLVRQDQNPVKFNPGKIKGGDWASSTPSWCEVDCRIAVLPGMSLEAFRKELSQVIMEAAKRDSFLANNLPEIIWNGFQADDYVLEPGSDFENAMRGAHRAVMSEEPAETHSSGRDRLPLLRPLLRHTEPRLRSGEHGWARLRRIRSSSKA